MMQNTSEAGFEIKPFSTLNLSIKEKMKLLTGILKTAIAASFLTAAFGIQAQTITDTNVTITGTFNASCSLSGNNVALGSADLPAYSVITRADQLHTRYPINLGVTCNSANIPWRLYNTNTLGVTLSIGSEVGNKACIADAAQTGHLGSHRCASNLLELSNGLGYISGTGSMTKPVHLLIWFAEGIVYYPYKGTGAINAVIPMRMEY